MLLVRRSTAGLETLGNGGLIIGVGTNTRSISAIRGMMGRRQRIDLEEQRELTHKSVHPGLVVTQLMRQGDKFEVEDGRGPDEVPVDWA